MVENGGTASCWSAVQFGQRDSELASSHALCQRRWQRDRLPPQEGQLPGRSCCLLTLANPASPVLTHLPSTILSTAEESHLRQLDFPSHESITVLAFFNLLLPSCSSMQILNALPCLSWPALPPRDQRALGNQVP